MSNSAVALIRELATLSGDMVQLAKDHNWDELAEHSARYKELSNSLEKLPMTGPPWYEADEFSAAATQIIANQEEIAKHLAPWLEDVRLLLKNSRREQTLVAAYRSAP